MCGRTRRPHPYLLWSTEKDRALSRLARGGINSCVWLLNRHLAGTEKQPSGCYYLSFPACKFPYPTSHVLWHHPSFVPRQARHPPLIPPSITISQFPLPLDSTQSASPALSHVLSLILPRLVTLPLSLQYLNTRGFVPESKDEDLHGGALQLPKGTVLLVTENGVGEGQLIEKGMLLVVPFRNSRMTP